MAMTIASSPTYAITPSAEKQTMSSNYVELYDYSHVHDADTYKRLHPRYGNGRITGFLKATGSESPFASDVMYHAEDGRLHKFISGATYAAGTITTTAAHDVRVGDLVVLSDDAIEEQATVTAVTTLTFDIAVKEGAASSLSTTASAVNCFVYGSEFAKGTKGFADGFNWKPDIYSSYPQILKETYTINESDMAHMSWIQTPQGYLWYLNDSYKTRIKFENQIELTQLINKRPASGAAYDAGSRGMHGLIPTINDRGNIANGRISSLAEMKEIVKRLNKQGDCKTFTVWADLDQRLGISDALGGVNGDFSGGNDYGVFQNSKDMAMYLDFNSWTVGGYTFHVTPFNLLDDPTLLGGENFDTTSIAALIVPASKKSVTEDGQTIAKPHLVSRYRAAGVVNRYLKTKVFGVGGTPIDEDGMKIQYLTERSLQVIGANEFFAVYRS